jgi:hypothetical protein
VERNSLRVSLPGLMARMTSKSHPIPNHSNDNDAHFNPQCTPLFLTPQW